MYRHQHVCNVRQAEHVGFGKTFKPAAKDRRGVTAWIEREGLFKIGDSLRLHVPAQRAWSPMGDLFS